ncbi:opine metallophore biosynthesis dehydrogenase [Longirhabdus pacifica]|uniref:opine metallophore biosynthesis dehydrogenase n=1 Tax=Longirhabdus pacifica TaxID=2305227 RepID=UPI001008A047|nr:opine metallophore biosynthesis dehydrogenase [Longirhabdus pacifica]
MNANRADQHAIQNVLLVGLGPAAAQMAVLLTNIGVKHIDIVTRAPYRSKEITAVVTKDGFPHLAGQARINNLETDMTKLDGEWDTIIYCTPNHVYEDITKKLLECECRSLERVLLLSPGIGDHALVQSLLQDKAVVVSLSTYFAATKWKASNGLSCITKNIKKKVYIGSSKGARCPSVMLFKQLWKQAGICLEVTENAWIAESRNITTYVHPPFFMNYFALEDIFFGSGPLKSMYKVYPEGPLTPQVIKDMVLLWKEITELLRMLNVKPLDLLRFLNDDNYPVPAYLLPRDHIDEFMSMSQKEQEYALYVRYTGLLIDPFSTPDQDGYYADFSRVPLKRIFKLGEGWGIPRVPLEDYRKIKRLVLLGEAMEVDLKTAKKLTQQFEHYVSRTREMNIVTIDLDTVIKQLQQEAIIISQQLYIHEG